MDGGPNGASVHYRALEALYASAPVNALFESRLEIVDEARERNRFVVDERFNHAAGAAHVTPYITTLADAAIYATTSMVTDRFLLTPAFNLHFTRPIRTGEVIAEGRWISGRRRVFIAESHL